MYSLFLLVTAAIIVDVAAQQDFAASIVETLTQQHFTTTNYTVRPVSGTTDLSGAVRIFSSTRTTIECGVKCSKLDLVSFFFVKQSSMCHCNDYVDSTVVPSNEQGHIKYGFIAGTATSSTAYSTPILGPCYMYSSYGVTNDWNSDWTTFQRRMDGSVDFNRNWTDYVNGFGSSDGELWLGLEEIHQNTDVGCELCVYLDAGPNNASPVEDGIAMYSFFSVGSSATNYRLFIDGFTGTSGIGDSLSYHNGASFTTYDNDNDDTYYNCTNMYSTGGWWHVDCFDAFLNALYNPGPQQDYGSSIKWTALWGEWFGLQRTEMSFRCN